MRPIKKVICNLLLIANLLPAFSREKKSADVYDYTIDLLHMRENKVPVKLLVPVLKDDTVIYHFPQSLPSLYAIVNYGRNISNLQAFDRSGNLLSATKTDINSWKIVNASRLYSISYLVDDFIDTTLNPIVLNVASFNIFDKDAYLVNGNSFLGYFDNKIKTPVEVTVLHPANLFGSSGFNAVDRKHEKDVIHFSSYNNAIDNPFLYSRPDTTSITVANSRIQVSVYSPSAKITSAFLAKRIDTALNAQAKYLGGKLPVDHYTFIIYLNNKDVRSAYESSFEHLNSSVYLMNESLLENINTDFLQYTSHEFLHVFTPINVRSERMANFNFNNPITCSHGWFYEGATEYNARMGLVKASLIDKKDFLDDLKTKTYFLCRDYSYNVSATDLGKYALSKYPYDFSTMLGKGFFISMFMDIQLLEWSNGKYGFIDLVKDLAKKYPGGIPFKEDDFFNEISRLTYPEMKTFLDEYVGSNKPLPFKSVFEKVGIYYEGRVSSKDSTFSMGFGKGGLMYVNNRLGIGDTTELNVIGKRLNYYPGDEIVLVNGVELTLKNCNIFLGNLWDTLKVGDPFIVRVARKNKAGEETLVDLKTVATKIPKVSDLLELAPQPNEKQLLLRKQWLEYPGGEGRSALNK